MTTEPTSSEPIRYCRTPLLVRTTSSPRAKLPCPNLMAPKKICTAHQQYAAQSNASRTVGCEHVTQNRRETLNHRRDTAGHADLKQKKAIVTVSNWSQASATILFTSVKDLDNKPRIDRVAFPGSLQSLPAPEKNNSALWVTSLTKKRRQKKTKDHWRISLLQGGNSYRIRQIPGPFST